MNLSLVVIRTSNLDSLVAFYSNFNLVFEYHKHGDSPYHYSTTIEKTVLEIYPLAKHQTSPDKSLRLGFAVDHFDTIITKLKNSGVKFLCVPHQTEFGYLAIVEDPDGRKIEIYKK